MLLFHAWLDRRFHFLTIRYLRSPFLASEQILDFFFCGSWEAVIIRMPLILVTWLQMNAEVVVLLVCWLWVLISKFSWQSMVMVGYLCYLNLEFLYFLASHFVFLSPLFSSCLSSIFCFSPFFFLIPLPLFCHPSFFILPLFLELHIILFPLFPFNISDHFLPLHLLSFVSW